MTRRFEMEPAIQFRVALTVKDFERALSFYRDVVGLQVQQEWSSEEGRGVVLSVKACTLEILDDSHSEMVDRIEVGRRVSGQVRFAFQFADLQHALAAALATGAELLNDPVETPWKDLNARLVGPDGMQVTFFQAPTSDPTEG
jgi:predicted enzyme related to lactoylglutathione lyase